MPDSNRWSWATERTLRLVAGSVLFAFAFTHFFNAGMGVFGIEAADSVRKIIGKFWELPPFALLLYSSFLVHIFLALRRLSRRRTWRMPWLEAIQTAFGLTIPLLLLRHVSATRGVEVATGTGPHYQNVFLALWPNLALGQATLLLLVWIHGCIGMFMAFRMRPWFQRWREVLFAGAVALPVFALAGFVAGGREADARFPEGFKQSQAAVDAFLAIAGAAYMVFWSALGLTVILLVYRAVRAQAGAKVLVHYTNGPTVRGRSGATLLEISRLNGVSHASVCGGKARCSTCRVRVVEGANDQTAPEQNERRLLARIGAPDTVRLACQLRPTTAITVQRLVDPGTATDRVNTDRDPFHWGVERRITLMFADIRGFTTISEKNFAFDIVFVLNRFQADMSRAIEANGGRIDKYLGDGLMAIFGADGLDDGGAAQAIAAARAMEEAVATLNREFRQLIGADLRIGVGLHTGPAILGRIGGSANSASLTALGDTVNSAARLEEMTKTFQTFCVASQATIDASGFDVAGAEDHEVPVRGRAEVMKVWAIPSFLGVSA